MKFKKLAFYAIVALILIGGQYIVTIGLVTGTPPPIAAQTLDGQSPMDPISRGPALIYFWADWCAICKAMQNPIDAVLRDYPGVTVALQSGSDEQVRAYLHRQGLRWSTVTDVHGDVAARYGVKGVPTVFIVDKHGKIRFTSSGYSSEAGLRLRLWLARQWPF